MDNNKKVLSEGWHVGSQSPIDDRLIFSNALELQNLGVNSQEVYRYYEGMEVYVIDTQKVYRWVESSTGLLAISFTYPSNIIVNDINYSNRSFNFVELNISSQTFPNPPVSVTYIQFNTLINNSQLVIGAQYLITDFQTIYDQPDFSAPGVAKTTVTTLTGPIEPLIATAVSTNEIAGEVLSTLYPNDHILYDPNFIATEVMGVAAKGRITQRTDTANNTVSYDIRNVLFKRYDDGGGYFTVYWDNGGASLSTIPTFASNTLCFNNYFVNNYDVLNPPSIQMPFLLNNSVFLDTETYEVKAGHNFYNNTFESYVRNITFGSDCYNNFIQHGSSSTVGNSFINNTTNHLDYTIIENKCMNNTFNYMDFCYIEDFFQNNTINGHIKLSKIGTNFKNNISTGSLENMEIEWDCINNSFVGATTCIIGNTFKDNVLGGGFASNKIGNRFINNVVGIDFKDNRIDAGCINNTIGISFEGNIIGTGFYNNLIGDSFKNNNIKDFFDNNTVNNDFISNITGNTGDFLGTSLLSSFSYNTVGSNTQNNTFGDEFINNVLCNDFLSNTIGNYCMSNIITSPSNGWSFNTIGDVCQNNTLGFFEQNNIDSWFRSNVCNDNFTGNIINVACYNNNFLLEVTNNVIGREFTNNTVNGKFENNTIGSAFSTNLINGNFYNNTTLHYILGNTFGAAFGLNYLGSDFVGNIIGAGATSNTIDKTFKYNVIGDGFTANTFQVISNYNNIGNDFTDNNAGNEFYGNTIGNNAKGNTFGDFTEANTIGANFTSNTIGGGADYFSIGYLVGFYQNTIGTDVINNTFGIQFMNNTLGDYFDSNIFGNYCWSNQLADNLLYNTFGDFFINNIITPVVGIPTPFQNNIFGNGCNFNTLVDAQFNTIGNGFVSNNINEGFGYNNIGDFASNNNIGVWFNYNKILNGFQQNTILTYFRNNIIANDFDTNNIADNFENNTIDYGFLNNTSIGSRFKFNNIKTGFKDNIIGDDFIRNILGNDFNDNTIGTNFNNNNIGNRFETNIVGNTVNNLFIQNNYTNVTIPNSTNTQTDIEGLATGFVKNTNGVLESIAFGTSAQYVRGDGVMATLPTGGTAVVNESKAIYIDATYGNDTTGTKYDLSKPFLTWAGAIAVAVTGDWIIFNAGSYNGGTMTPVNNVNVFCKPGVTISGGFAIASSITWKFLGDAIFTSTDPLRVVSTGQTYDIQFDFDKIEGVISFGIILADNTSPLLKLLVNCNSIIANQPLRLNGGACYDVVVNCKSRLSSFGSQAIVTGNSSLVPMTGSIVINCPIIETTSTASNRTVIALGNSTRNLTINSSLIRSTSTTFTDSGISNLGCLVFATGDNCIINGNLDGGVIPCIINNTAGGTPVYGNTTFIGNMYSEREIVQHYQKAANGNGWQNIIIKNGYISSKGIGSSNAMFHRANAWNSVMNGIPGNIQLIDCVVHNKNFNASATAAIMKDDVNLTGTTGWVIKQNNFQMFNCFAFINGAIGYLISTIQTSKQTSLHNVRSNVDKMAVVADTFSPTGLIIDTNLIIPTSNL